MPNCAWRNSHEANSCSGQVDTPDGKAVMANRILEYLDRVELYEPSEKSKSHELYLNYYGKLIWMATERSPARNWTRA
jgi:hypothetical protein